MTNECSNRSRWLTGCGAAALTVALALAPSVARADAFQATPTTVVGTVNYDRSTTGQDRIEVTSPTAIIDWTPQLDVNGDPLTFLPAGNVATFYDAPAQGGFAVLNRILPTSNGGVTVMNGSVVSSLQTSAGVFQPGGFVAFYSPTGFLIGSTATFDVGCLMLTTLEPSPGSFDAFATSGGPLDLGGFSVTPATITISPGATITAPAEGSFFIAAGSQLNIGGTVSVNGSHAYVAADQATLTHNAGLFDIIIPIGTNVENALTINGDIGGPSSGGVGDNHMIYAVAHANGNPIDLVFGGNLGFAPAASAGIVNGEIILSANYDVFGRTVNGSSTTEGNLGTFTGRQERSTVAANIFVTDANISSSALVISSHAVEMAALNGPSVVDGNLQLVARQDARLRAEGGQTFLITGDALIASNDQGLIGSSFQNPTDINASAGFAYVEASSAGIVSINGNAAIRANATTGLDALSQAGGSAQAGQAGIRATGGTVNIGGSATITSIASFGSPGPLASGGNISSGTAQIVAGLNGLIDISGAASLDTRANAPAANAGNSAGIATTGGTVLINVFDVGGSILFGSDLSAVAQASSISGNASGAGASASGGSIAMIADAASATIDVAGNVQFFADAFASSNVPGTGGTATGGQARIGTGNGGVISLDGNVTQAARGFGGAGATGGAAFGGTSAMFSSSGSITAAGNVSLDANAIGGAGSSTTGGAGTAGRASISTGGGAITIGGSYEAASIGQGGNGVAGGNGTGGIAGAIATLGIVSLNQTATIRSEGRGGAASIGFGGTGGTGQGGNAFLQAEGTLVADGRLTLVQQAILSASGTGGAGGNANASTISAGAGGAGFGGNPELANAADPMFGNGAYVLAQGDRGYLTLTGGVLAESNGLGGQGGSGIGPTGGGAGGSGQGGLAQFGLFVGTGNGSVSAGRAEFGGLALARANGVGGNSGINPVTGARTGTGGNGNGGGAILASRLSDVVANQVLIQADGIGGVGATGGVATGGDAGLLATANGTLTANTATIRAFATGGAGQAATGGAATGGAAFIGFHSGTMSILADATVTANAVGGASTNANGAVGTGGIADIGNISATAGIATIGGAAVVTANGMGGEALTPGFTGGAGAGGEAYLLAQASASLQTGSAQVVASGTGGSGPSAKGGDGSGGLSYIEARGTGSSITVSNNPVTGTDLAAQRALLGAMGIGGNTSGADGIGGTGTGGTINVLATNGGTIALPIAIGPNSTARLLARGQGGDSGVDGGAGGLGVGGILTINVDGGTLNAVDILASAYAQGGTSTISTLNVDGGDARDGSRNITIENGGIFSGSFGAGIAGGAGGNGTGTGDGGNASGGIATLVVDGGTASLAGLSIVAAQNTGGNADSGAGGTATGGLATVEVINGGAITIGIGPTGAEQLAVSSITQGGNSGTGSGGAANSQTARLTVLSGGSITGGAVLANANAVGGTSAAGVGGDASAGLAQARFGGATSNLDSVTVDSGAQGGTSVSGTHGAASAGAAQLVVTGSSLNVAGVASVLANAVTGVDTSQFPSTATGGDAAGGNAILSMLAGNLTADQIVLSSRASALQTGTATGGTSSLGITASTITALGEIFVAADASSAGGTTATGGTIAAALQRILAALPLTAPPSLLTTPLFTVTANASGASTTTGGAIGLGVIESRANIDNLVVSALGGTGGAAVTWSAQQNGIFGVSQQATFEVSGGVDITTATGGLIGGPTISAPTANISIRTPQSITIDGDNDNAISFGGLSLALESAELNILDGARIGGESVSLTSNNTTAAAVIGGTTEEPGYTLTAVEAERIEVGSFEFSGGIVTSSDPNAPDLIIRDITVSGSDGDGTNYISVDVDGDTSAGGQGIIRVEGQVVYIDAISTDELEIEAGQRVEIVTPGGIAVLNADGAPGGLLRFESPSVWAADAATITQLQANPSFTGRNDLLATAASGSDDPLGYIRGGTVAFEANGAILIRNTGTSDEQGGITVGAGGLSIALDRDLAGASEPLDVFAYGRQQNPDDTFVTGADFYALVNFNQSGSSAATPYLAGSEFNDCDIVSGECPREGGDLGEVDLPISNPVTIEGPMEDAASLPATEDKSSEEFGFDFPGLIETSSISEQATFDEGVMSGSDSSIYVVTDGSAPTGVDDDDSDYDEENQGGE